MQVLVEKGISSVRVADVADRAGTSATSVIYYFGSKAALFEEAIAGADDAFYAEMLADIGRLESGVDRLTWLVVRSSHTDWLLWMELWNYARRHPELLDAHRRIRHGQGRGEFGPADVDAVSMRLGSIMRGLAIHVSLGGHEVDSEAMAAHTLRLAALELGCDEEVLLAAAARQAAAAVAASGETGA
jgi:TetR/AcrR family transcriptional repressor of bet genes